MMTLTSSVFYFEARYHLRRPSFWLVAGVFGVFGFVDMLSQAKQGHAYFYANSPLQIFFKSSWYGFFSILAATAFVAETFVRDKNYITEELILSTPINKRQLLGARFVAAFGVGLLAYSCYMPTMFLATQMPGLNPYALGPFRPLVYLSSYLLIAVPNYFLVCSVAFAIAARTRSMVFTYAGAIVLVMLYFVSLIMAGIDSISYEELPFWAMIDPFGFYAINVPTLHWNVHQQNTLMPEISSLFLYNRMLWLAVSFTLWAGACRRYQMRCREPKLPSSTVSQLMEPVFLNVRNVVVQEGNLSSVGKIIQWKSRSWFEMCSIFRGRAFWLLTGFGVLSLLLAGVGRRSYNFSNPSTDILVHSANIYLHYVLFILIVVYAAELMWRDRTLRLQEMIDATEVSDFVLMLSKLTALSAMIILNLLMAMVVMLGCQIVSGYSNYEIPLYFQMLFAEHGPYFFFTAVLALFLQAVTRHKYAGMALVVLASLAKIPLDSFGLYHNLYRWAETNDIDYSPMNGYGHLFRGHLWYSLYWGSFCFVLLVLTYLYWPRGTLERNSWVKIWQRSTAGSKALLTASILFLGIIGSWIYFNTTVLNAYQPPGKDETAAQIERRYKQYENLPMPVVTHTQLEVEIYPEERYFVAKGKYTLENRTDEPIREIHLLSFIHLKLENVQYPGAKLREASPDWGYYIFDLETPLEPGQSQDLTFVTRVDKPLGFRNHVDSDDVYMVYPNEVVQNGTNLYSPFILPLVGYSKIVEHKKEWKRTKFDLPPLDSRMRGHDDPQGLFKAMRLSHQAWGSYEVTIGTSANQIAVCAGELVSKWTENDRNFFRYRSTERDRGRFSIYSARYAIHRDMRCRIPIEIYYHPEHQENINLIAEELANAFQFYEENFGPYPYGNLRLVEFVYYDGATYSDSGTIGIPEVMVWKTESHGLGRQHIVDWLTFELAKAWWDNQIIVADVAGSMTIREALSEYASKLYQREKLSAAEQRSLQTQRLRKTFRKLGKAEYKEPPLADVYNEIVVARYKGGLVLELIEELVGKELLLKGLRDFLSSYRFQDPPYATVIDLQEALFAVAPEHRATIGQLFSQVLTFEAGITDAAVKELLDGRYEVTLEVKTQRLRTTGLGEQEALPFDLPVEITLADDSHKTIYAKKHRFMEPTTKLRFVVESMPTTATIDSRFRLPSAFVQDNDRKLRFIEDTK